MAVLTKDMSTPENRSFWKYVEDTAHEVRSWPAWKRGQAELPNNHGDTLMDKYDKYEEDFKEALRGHKRVQLMLPFDRRIEAMNKEAMRILEKKKGVHSRDCGCANCNPSD